MINQMFSRLKRGSSDSRGREVKDLTLISQLRTQIEKSILKQSMVKQQMLKDSAEAEVRRKSLDKKRQTLKT